MKLLWVVLAAASQLLSVQATASIPACSVACVTSLVQPLCGSISNVTCLCENAQAMKKDLTACVLQACSIPESLELELYQANICDVKSDMSMVQEQMRLYYIFPALTTIFVLLRLLSRRLLNLGVREDDYMMIAALIAYYADCSSGLAMVMQGFGQHTWYLSTDQINESLKFFYICELFYILTITLTKLSLLLFFRRIFPSEKFNICVWIMIGFVIASNFSILMALTFQCLPFYGNWTNWAYKVNPVQCIDQYAAVFVAAGLSITHDAIILVMPLPLLWKLQLHWRKKVNLLFMFSVGSFVLICSLIRLPSLLKLQSSLDTSYDQAPIAVWTDLEMAVGIMCGCLPACRSLVGWVFPALKMSLQGSSAKKSAYGLGYSKQSKNTSRMDPLDQNFIELNENSDSERGRRDSIKSQSSTIPFRNSLVPSGKEMGHRTYVKAVEPPQSEIIRGVSLERNRARANSRPEGDGGIMMTRSVLMTEQRSGPRR
ncbi:hypothetical protein BP6252_01734 [Coleophoma cylindrospora]|uniref:Uncharacterized protein n=1 Tax=Coleophoma cylindrospora TaxID=1849047 RepID=A0A3D8STR7_9HELO|nr:hypothetical protein BP6252_01734 [Coleophoma cylindrospora]